MSGPLEGVRVLDLSRILSGPFCTMVLADLGAEVVKVERPGQGDPARSMVARVGDDSAFFISVNRGKKSITLDVFSEEGRGLFLRLVPHFDVLVENFVPGTLAKAGLHYASLSKVNPRLVYASISGFGQDGPYAQRPALDIIVQAMSGLMSVTGEPDGPPLRPGASLGDSIPGAFAAIGILAALHQRERTGLGQRVDIAMLDTLVTMMENSFSRYFATGQVPEAIGSRHPGAAPFQAFRAGDGWFVVAMLTDDATLWQRFCQAAGLEALASDPRFQDNRGRTQHVEELAALLQAAFAKKTRSYWLEALGRAAVPCGPVNTIADVTQDAQVQHRGMLAAIPHPAAGAWLVANTPFKLSGATAGPAGPSPALGEHTAEVLGKELGLTEADVGQLRERGVV
ncbi:MAG: CoA transferase [Chloroflexi bacterium]|nr:CoA transferase [Chloroflexota bacterium]